MTPHPSVLTPPPYKNKHDYKGGTNDKTHNSHTRETSVSWSDDDSLARNLDSEKKIPSVLNPHPWVFTPPPYKNKKLYKVGTNDKTRDSHTRETSVSRSDHDSLARNLDAENKSTEDDECNDHLSIKKDKIDSQSHEKIRKRLLFKKNQKN